jgi:hypothetical protein
MPSNSSSKSKRSALGLKDSFTKQAVDYSTNQGSDWVILTNGDTWRVYKVHFSKPIDQELVLQFNFLELNHKKVEDLELIYNLSREGWVKSALGEFHAQKQAFSRFFLGAMILDDSFLSTIRRELRKVSPDVKIDIEQIRSVLTHEVLKREVIEGEKADDARRKMSRLLGKEQKAKAARASLSASDSASTENKEAPPISEEKPGS